MTSIFFTYLRCFLDKVQGVKLLLVHITLPLRQKKGTATFWRVWGVVTDLFTKSRRKIASGTEMTSDEAMRAIHIQTTPKGDPPN